MSEDLTLKDLASFEEAYQQTPLANVLARTVQENGVVKASKNYAAKKNHDRTFSIEVKTGKITNQKKSGRCWLFATLNVLRQQVADKLKVKDFEFSQNYDSFYDRLEKTNFYYEKMIELADRPNDDREYLFYLDWGNSDGGQFANGAALIEKYGLVPKSVMPETYTSEHTAELNDVLNLKLKKDTVTLRQMHQDGASDEELRTFKKEQMKDVYRMLVYAFGQPPVEFDFEYRDDDNNYHIDRHLTPKDFLEKYVDFKAGDYTSLVDAPDHELGGHFNMPSQEYIFNGPKVDFLTVATKELKDAVIAQLKDGKAVWFGCDVLKDMDRKEGILDTEYFKQDELFGLDLALDKKKRLESREAACSHAMAFTGVDLVEGKPTKWKVENSWGDENGDKGYFIMTDAWFDAYVYEIVVDKKYLTKAQQEIAAKAVKPLAPWDSLA